jgi:undecaprenyl-diphosphatase
MVVSPTRPEYAPRSSGGGPFVPHRPWTESTHIALKIQRVRPYDAGVTNLLIERSSDFSFPSDHATAAFAIAAAFWFGGLRGRGFAFLIAALMVAASRVYVGTHYVGDVLGGAGTGIIAALLVRAVYWKDTRFDRFLTSIF